jgi:two-component sensor histidine kinase
MCNTLTAGFELQHRISLRSFLIMPLLLTIACPGFPQGNSITDSLYLILRESKPKAALLNALAAEYLNIFPLKAEELSEEALEAARKEKNDLEEAGAWHNIACVRMSLGSYDTALVMLGRSKEIFSRLKSAEGLLRVENSRANLCFLQGQLDDALEKYNSNLAGALKENLPAIRTTALANIGRINWLKGKYDTALQWYNDALVMADSLRNQFMRGMINLLAGIAYQDMGYYELAAARILLAGEIFEKMNYLSKLPYTYNYLGSVYFELQENEMALESYRKALERFKINGDEWGTALTYRYLGRSFRRLQLPDSALRYFRASLQLANNLKDRSGELYSRRFLAEVILEQGRLDSARLLFNENIDKSVMAGNIREKANNLYDLGLLYVREKKLPDAIRFLNDAAAIADSLDLFYENMLINKQLSETYEQMNDPQMALAHYKVYKSLSDTIFTAEKRKNIDELQLRYETEKKNSEISGLKMEQKVQAEYLRTQRILGYSLAVVLILVIATTLILWHSYKQKKKADHEKEILLKEIHHRVKNNLQTISSLLSLQSHNIADQVVKDAVKESQDRVKSMALIHQMLYQQEKLSMIDFGQYLHQLADSIASGYGRPEGIISCTVDCDNVELDIDTAIPLGLIANELIVNAYKYAFKPAETGELNVALTRVGSHKFTFSVRDNGRGMPDNFRIDRTETLGLRLVALLARQLRGEVSCINNNGTEFRITF